jgi:Ca2+-binding EF-hand superfamily protein
MSVSAVKKIREVILKRIGENGIRAISSAFRVMDDNSNQMLSSDEFRTGLRDCGILLSDEDFLAAMSHFDKNSDGNIDVTEFLVALRGTLAPRRQRVIEIAFDRFDVDKTGVIDLNDLREVYDVSRHPQVLAGKITEAEALLSFLTLFDDQSNPDGRVTKEEFIAYYTGLSASIDNDDYFEAIVIRAWNLDKPLALRKRREAPKMPTTVNDLPQVKRAHPLYVTTQSSYGAQVEGHTVSKERFRTGDFTKNYFGPPRHTGLNTSVTRSVV